MALRRDLKTVDYKDGKVFLIDQTKLPERLEIIAYDNYKDLNWAIKNMVVRGAPAIGAAAALSMVLGARSYKSMSLSSFREYMVEIANEIKNTRPTAVNLFWAVDRILSVVLVGNIDNINILKENIVLEGLKILEEDIEANKRIGEFGAVLIKDGWTILTHCNAGALATVAYGTALGVIRAAFDQGKHIKVYADETRPRLQGAKLTAWELVNEGIPVRLISDNMAGYFMSKNEVNMVIVGADRIAANGDTANKIGTYSVAVLAKEHNIPFYVAAPTSTIDKKIPTGLHIPIEERNPKEVMYIGKEKIAPDGVEIVNPAFDVTPNKYITGIITEKGVLKQPYLRSIEILI